MLQLIKRCPEYVSGYKDYCQELYDHHMVFFRPTDPQHIDDNWFFRTKPWCEQKKQGMEKVLLTINAKNAPLIHICEKLGEKLQDTIEAHNEAEGQHLLRRYWITL